MVLEKGSVGFLIRMLQEDLVLLGYDLGTTGPNKDGVDGIFGTITEAAVKTFQQAQGFTGSEVDGVFGQETEEKMEVAITAIRQAMRDEVNHKLLGTVSGQVVGDAFYFGLPVKNQAGEFENVLFLFDTGAFKMLLTSGTAQGLQLPNNGSIEISGVGGGQAAYNTQVTFQLGGNEFTITAVVDESTAFGINLFGADWQLTAQMTTKIDWHAKTVSFYAYSPQEG